MSVSADFAAESREDRQPCSSWGSGLPAGGGCMPKHTPTLAQTGFTSAVYADGAWLADGNTSAGEGSEPVISRRRDVLKYGVIKESLAGRTGEPLSILAGGRTVELQITLDNGLEPEGWRYFSKVAAIEGLVGGKAEVEATYPELGQRDALRRFSGRVRRAEWAGSRSRCG